MSLRPGLTTLQLNNCWSILRRKAPFWVRGVNLWSINSVIELRLIHCSSWNEKASCAFPPAAAAAACLTNEEAHRYIASCFSRLQRRRVEGLFGREPARASLRHGSACVRSPLWKSERESVFLCLAEAQRPRQTPVQCRPEPICLLLSLSPWLCGPVWADLSLIK